VPGEVERMMTDELPTFEGSRVRHGTVSGYAIHEKRKERPCDPCYFARQKYDHDLAAQPPKVVANRARAAIQRKALKALVHRHLEEYNELYREFREESK
jgi:hypothetical protein